MYCWMLSCVREIPCLFSQEWLGSVLRRPFGLSRDKVYLNRSTQWQGRYRNCGARGMGRLKMPLIYRIHLRKVSRINEIDMVMASLDIGASCIRSVDETA